MTKRLPTITQDEWRDAYQAAKEAVRKKPDFSKGKTSREWADVWSKIEGRHIGVQSARRTIADYMDAGLMLDDMDWREWEGTMRRTPVYRFAEKKGAAKRA